jgi:DNA-directed RNA polymerase specialized sigma24 family protein
MDMETIAQPEFEDEVLALNDALDALAEINPQIGQFVTLRYFGGMTIREASETLGVSSRTGDAYWAYARAWLLAEIQQGHAG